MIKNNRSMVISMVLRIYAGNIPAGPSEREQENEVINNLVRQYILNYHNPQRVKDMYIFTNFKLGYKKEVDVFVMTPSYGAILELKNKTRPDSGEPFELIVEIKKKNDNNKEPTDRWYDANNPDYILKKSNDEPITPINQLYHQRYGLKNILLDLGVLQPNYYLFSIPIFPLGTKVKKVKKDIHTPWLYIPKFYDEDIYKKLVLKDESLPINSKGEIGYVIKDIKEKLFKNKKFEFGDRTKIRVDEVMKEILDEKINNMRDSGEVKEFLEFLKLITDKNMDNNQKNEERNDLGFSKDMKEKLEKMINAIEEYTNAQKKDDEYPINKLKKELNDILLPGKSAPSKEREEKEEKITKRIRKLLTSNLPREVEEGLNTIERLNLEEEYFPTIIELFKEEKNDYMYNTIIKPLLLDFIFSFMGPTQEYIRFVEKYLFTKYLELETKIFNTLLVFDQLSFSEETYTKLKEIVSSSCDKSEIMKAVMLLGKTGKDDALDALIELYSDYEKRFWNFENLLKDEGCTDNLFLGEDEKMRDVIYMKALIIDAIGNIYSQKALQFLTSVLDSEDALKFSCIANTTLDSIYNIIEQGGPENIQEEIVDKLKEFISEYKPQFHCDTYKEVFRRRKRIRQMSRDMLKDAFPSEKKNSVEENMIIYKDAFTRYYEIFFQGEISKVEEDIEEYESTFQRIIEVLGLLNFEKSCELLKYIFLKFVLQEGLSSKRQSFVPPYHSLYKGILLSLKRMSCGITSLIDILSQFDYKSFMKSNSEEIRYFNGVLSTLIELGKDEKSREIIIKSLTELIEKRKEENILFAYPFVYALILLKAKEKEDLILNYIDILISQDEFQGIREGLRLLTRLWILKDDEAIKKGFKIIIKYLNKSELHNKIISLWINGPYWLSEADKLISKKEINRELLEELYGEYADIWSDIVYYNTYSKDDKSAIQFWKYVMDRCEHIYSEDLFILLKSLLHHTSIQYYEDVYRLHPLLQCVIKYVGEKVYEFLTDIITNSEKYDDLWRYALTTFSFLAKRLDEEKIMVYEERVVKWTLEHAFDSKIPYNFKALLFSFIREVFVDTKNKAPKHPQMFQKVEELVERTLRRLVRHIHKKKPLPKEKRDILYDLLEVYVVQKGESALPLLIELLRVKRHPSIWYPNFNIEKYCPQIQKDTIQISSPHILDWLFYLPPTKSLPIVLELELPWYYPCDSSYYYVSKINIIYNLLRMSKDPSQVLEFGKKHNIPIPQEIRNIIDSTFENWKYVYSEEDEKEDPMTSILYVLFWLWGIEAVDYLFDKLKSFAEDKKNLLKDGFELMINSMGIGFMYRLPKEYLREKLLEKRGDKSRYETYQEIIFDIKRKILEIYNEGKYKRKMYWLAESVVSLEKTLKGIMSNTTETSTSEKTHPNRHYVT